MGNKILGYIMFVSLLLDTFSSWRFTFGLKVFKLLAVKPTINNYVYKSLVFLSIRVYLCCQISELSSIIYTILSQKRLKL